MIDDIVPKEIRRLSQELKAGSYQPKPVRRQYIPKRSGKLRPLGIPSARDKVVQSGVALILEALYESLFRPCSHGFRAGHSPITALRQVSSAYRAGATWIVEGDIADCFGSLPHQVILNSLRKRIRDERFIDLVRKLLQAGMMEKGTYVATYSGAPQGGVASPILANVVLHEFDCWMETQWEANPPALTPQEQNARSNPQYMRLHYRNVTIRRYLDGKLPIPKKTNGEALRAELREKLRLRRLQPRSLPRRVIRYCRFADDFLVVLCNVSKEETLEMKAEMAAWLQENLGLTLNVDKTLITHWRKKLRFLGYELEGRANQNGTRWLHLSVPKEAVRQVVAKIKQATAYPQAPAYDVFQNVNAISRGWMNYYGYAHNNNGIGGKLSMVVYWCTVHYLAKKHRYSIAKIMRRHYHRDPSTGCKALCIYRPGQPASPETRYFLWHKPRKRRLLASASIRSVQDRQRGVNVDWAEGRSQHKRLETLATANHTCQHCGSTDPPLYVHHPNRLGRVHRKKKGVANLAQSGMEQQTKLLCRKCHMAHHQGCTRPRSQK